MNIIIGRLILFVNTTLKYDVNYEIAMFIITRYPQIDDLNIKLLMDECFVSRASIKRFCELFGFHSWLEFQNELIKSKNVKTNQLKSNYTAEQQQLYLNHLLDFCQSDEKTFKKLYKDIQSLAKDIAQCKSVFLFGAIYPLSLCVEFQTNMISIGKTVYLDYHSLEEVSKTLDEKDMAIILSASGRYIRECSKKFHQIYFSSSTKALLTLSDQFETLDKINYYIKFPQMQQIYDYNLYVMYFLELLFCECYLNNWGKGKIT